MLVTVVKKPLKVKIISEGFASKNGENLMF